MPKRPEEIFPFFSDAVNLERITPSFLHFRIVTPLPITMGEGTIIDYRLKLHGVPVRWRSLIPVWEPDRGFVDQQIQGPYREWYHEHTFEAVEGGCLCRDRVDYLAPCGRAVGRLFVDHDVLEIFRFRQTALADLLM
ncbi:MAG TPA: SRPBCC family protein [Kiritimatiellia bacterium]|nr:SRPBCC family protein [Kiritimatiellia bacterium]